MKICKTDLHIILEEREKPRVVHQQGQILLNYSMYIKNMKNLRRKEISFQTF